MTHSIQTAISRLPLKKMDGTLLVQALYEYAYTVKEIDSMGFRYGADHVRDAIAVASYAHRNQFRANRGELPKTHYIEHPLRNAVRLLRYGFITPQGIIATILHDTVEDAPAEVVALLDPDNLNDDYTEYQWRESAYRAIMDHFGYEVSMDVRALSNPLPQATVKLSQDQKKAVYLAHFEESIKDPMVFWEKMSDWMDNGAGLKHNVNSKTGVKITFRAPKYLEAGLLLCERLLLDAQEDDEIRSLVSAEGYSKACTQIQDGIESLRGLIAGLPV
jgi:hypothetical protein